MDFSEKIKRLRKGRSPEWVAKQVECSGVSVRRMEIGDQEPKIRLGLAMARLFEVSFDWLCDDGADWPPPASDEQQAAEMVREALTGGGLAGELTDEERELLATWRRMAPNRRGHALGYLIGLATSGSLDVAEIGAEVSDAADRADRHEQARGQDGPAGRRQSSA